MKNTDKITINREYKDRLFRLLFGDTSNKENILSLYNALNHSDYKNAEDLEITTLEDSIYMHMKDDVSFLIDSYLTLWEQQSTFNPNMPLRGLMYFGRLYNSYIESRGLDIYHSTLAKIPTPRYVVFYNGTKEVEPVIKLRLSDAFIHPDEAHEFEWTATMVNLNQGKNEELLAQCRILSDYMTLINKIRYYVGQQKSVEEAVDMAVMECIEEDVLAEFLRKHRGEVMGTCLTEFNEELYRKSLLEEGQQRLAILIKKLLSEDRMTDVERVVDDIDYREKLYEEYGIK